MKILMVYPQNPDTFWSFKHVLRFVSKRSPFPPLGLLTVAAMLPKMAAVLGGKLARAAHPHLHALADR